MLMWLSVIYNLATGLGLSVNHVENMRFLIGMSIVTAFYVNTSGLHKPEWCFISYFFTMGR